MNVSEQEYIATMDDIVAALNDHGVAPPEVGEVVAILYSLRGDILRG
jgi:hemoglobin